MNTTEHVDQNADAEQAAASEAPLTECKFCGAQSGAPHDAECPDNPAWALSPPNSVADDAIEGDDETEAPEEQSGAADGEQSDEIRTTVDGTEARIIRTPPLPIFEDPSLEEAMQSVVDAQDEYAMHAAEAKLVNEAKKEAQERLNEAIATAVRIYKKSHGDDPQMVLGEDGAAGGDE